MGFLDKFRKKETRTSTLEEVLLSAGLITDTITVENALNIPTVAGCVDLISKTVAMLPIKLYKEKTLRTESLVDSRIDLLNDDTQDTLDGYQFKKAIIEDYLLRGAGYTYINKELNKVKSLHYVDNRNVSINANVDPIFKDFNILVNGTSYRQFQFLKLTRKTKDGATGVGIVKEHNQMLAVAYNTLTYENVLVKTGGNKKGFLTAKSKLTQEAIDILKTAWNNLYKNNTENVVVLNDGLEFKEASSTSVEMQLNENKKTNGTEICKLFNVPPALLDGKATDEEYNNFIKLAILPILKAFETSLNKELLLESEKGSLYFAFDIKDLLKGDMYKRYQAYEIAIKNGFMQWDEVRYIEDYKPYNLNFIKLGLQDVLYNTKTGQIYTPNTDKSTMLTKGGDKNEN
jgi:HK97 family phage portal protein